MSAATPRISRHALSHVSAIHRPTTSQGSSVRSTRATAIHERRRHVRRPRYAYFTLVMCGDEYAIGAAVLGWSIRKQGTKHELVVMVTPDVTVKARKLLMKIYDRVERIKYIHSVVQSTLRGGEYRQEKSWMKYCLTKAAMLKFVEYDKIIWMDADMLALGNLDVLFQLSAPAGICTSIRDQGRWHGVRIPEMEIQESVLNNYGVKGCIMVLEPNVRHYLLSRSQQRSGHERVYLGPDEYFFTMLYKNTWHHLDQKYGCSDVHETKATQPLALHFDHAKPWQHKQDSAWSWREQWWAAARDLICEHSDMQGIVPVQVRDLDQRFIRPWMFLSPTEKVSYKLKNDYRLPTAGRKAVTITRK